MTLWFSGPLLEVKERCTFLCSQSNAEEKVIYRANPQICTDVPHASISTSFLKYEWRSECTGKAKRTLAPSVFPSQLLTQCLACGPSYLTGEVRGHTIATVAAAISALPFPQDRVSLHPIGPYPKLGLQFRTSREDWARQFRWGERDWNQEPDQGYKPSACQEGHKEQEGWKKRGSTHVANK